MLAKLKAESVPKIVMSVAKDLELIESTAEDVIFPPEEIYSDEPPLETELHLRQIILLLQCLELCWQDRNDFYAVGNLTIYYSQRQRKSEEFRGQTFLLFWGQNANLAKVGWFGMKTACIPPIWRC